MERMAVDRKRRAAVFRNTADGSAHLGQRIDDASHRPFLNGSVTGQCTGKVLAGKNAGDQACRCSAVSAVENGGAESPCRPFP